MSSIGRRFDRVSSSIFSVISPTGGTRPPADRTPIDFAAWFGLVPKQRSSGGRARLFGISKRGDRYLRTLMIHGARAALGKAAGKQDPRSLWLGKMRQRPASQCRGCRARQQECTDRLELCSRAAASTTHALSVKAA